MTIHTIAPERNAPWSDPAAILRRSTCRMQSVARPIRLPLLVAWIGMAAMFFLLSPTSQISANEPRLAVNAPRQWRVSEFTFTGRESYPSQPLAVQPTATFHGPGGVIYDVPGFWDGARTWKVRFTPDRPGKWTYVTRAIERATVELDQLHNKRRDTDDAIGARGSAGPQTIGTRTSAANSGRRAAGLDAQRGTFTAAPADANNGLFQHGGILHVSADHRYLTYTDGTPFFWLGDTWWFCPSDLLPIDGSSNPDIASAYKRAIATRRRQGFTIVQMDFLDHIRDTSAFADFQRTQTIDVRFWRTVDRYIAVANDAGIIPVVGMGWSGRPLDLDQWRILWRYVVARYGACGISWLVCGEYNVQHVSDRKIAATLQVGRFIKSIDPWKRAMTIHPWYFRGDRRQAWQEPWYDFIMLQGGHGNAPPVDVYADAWRHQPTRPVLEGECAYEGIHTFTARDVRNRAWRAMQSGCFGYTYGSHGLWYPTQNERDTRTKEWGTPTPWWIALQRPGAEQMGRMRAIYESVPWWRLEPLPAAISIDRGVGTQDGAVSQVVDLIARFDSAQSASALWCKVFRHPWAAVDLPEIELHPKDGTPATLTWPALPLPDLRSGEALRLVLALGMDPRANLNDPQHPSDGVTYVITVNGTTLLRLHDKSKQWAYQSLDLTEFAGSTVTLTLATEAGKNSAWDHARFRAPVVLRGPRNIATPRRNIYTSALPEPILVKADHKNMFVVYFPACENTDLPQFLLHGLAPGKAYTATWHDPRTGKPSATAELSAANDGTPVALPKPPDSDDWVLILQQE